MSTQDRNAQPAPQRDHPSHHDPRDAARNEGRPGKPGHVADEQRPAAKHRPAGTQRQPQAAQTGSSNKVGDLEKQQELFK